MKSKSLFKKLNCNREMPRLLPFECLVAAAAVMHLLANSDTKNGRSCNSLSVSCYKHNLFTRSMIDEDNQDHK